MSGLGPSSVSGSGASGRPAPGSREPSEFSAEDFCYVTTRGRRTGRPHTIEIWFAVWGRTLYLLAGDHRSDWVLNIQASPSVHLRLGAGEWQATARIVTAQPERATARRLVLEKYAETEEGLSEWAAEALPVAVEPILPATPARPPRTRC